MAFEEQIILEVDIDESDAVESIESLTAANKKLREERKSLNLLTEEGRKRTAAINAELDKNNNKIKENSSALEKQRSNIGNYKSALDGVHPALGKVGGALEGGAKGFMSMTRAALAFIATPIGAVLAAIVVVFTLLKTALSQNDALMDKFENVTNAVSVVMEVLVNRVAKLGEALIALFSGDINGAINATSAAFSGLAEEIGNAVKQQQLLLDETRNIEDAQRALRIETARQENEIRRLVVAAKNRNLTFDEQEGLLRSALTLEKELVRQREDLALRELRTTARQLRASKEFQQQSNETFDQYIERLLDSSALAPAELDKIAEKVEALEQARGSSLAFQEKVENSLSAIQEKRAEALEKQNAALREQADLRRAEERAQSNVDTAVNDPLIDAFETRVNVITDLDKRFQEDTLKRDAETKAQQAQNERRLTDLKEQQQRERLAALGQATDNAAIIFGEESAAYKTLASAQTLISTYLSAQQAFSALAGIPIVGPALGGIAAAAAVVAGLARVAAINGVEFAEGGYTGPGPKLKPAGIVHAGEVVWSQQDVAAVGGPMAANRMRPTYRGYADGGLVTNSISQPINQQLELSNILKNMPPTEVSVVEISRKQKRVQVKEQMSKR